MKKSSKLETEMSNWFSESCRWCECSMRRKLNGLLRASWNWFESRGCRDPNPLSSRYVCCLLYTSKTQLYNVVFPLIQPFHCIAEWEFFHPAIFFIFLITDLIHNIEWFAAVPVSYTHLVPSLGKNAYFDKDGFVVEISSEIIPGVTKINGLSVQTAELYKKLSIGENSKLLRTLLSVTQLLKKYERVPEVILIQNSNCLLYTSRRMILLRF